jgi:IclR family transcriptional regulator, blcABC operon repressor
MAERPSSVVRPPGTPDPVPAEIPPGGQHGNPQVVPSVLRAIRILNALAAGPPSASLASLSKRLQLPRSSTLALCNSLLQAEMLTRDPDGAFRIGPHVLELSRSYLRQTDLHTEFERAISELGGLRAQTVVCAVLRERHVVYIARRAGTYPVSVNYEVGMRLPAHCTASGLALLAGLSDAELLDHYDGHDADSFEILTPRSIRSLPELMRRLTTVRIDGYAVDDEETALGMLCIGAGIRDDNGKTVGAVAVSIAKAALQDGEVPGLATEVRRLGDRISSGLGAPPT